MKIKNNPDFFLKCLGSVIVCFLLFVYIIPSMDMTQERQESVSMYPPLKKIKDEIKGRVISNKQNRGWSGTYAIDLSNNTRFSLSGATINKNYKYRYQDLMDIVEGDSIYKAPYSDTIYVYRNNQEYYYCIGKIIP